MVCRAGRAPTWRRRAQAWIQKCKHGFKLVKWIKGIEFVADYSDIGSGYGGYSEDHKYFGRHQTL